MDTNSVTEDIQLDDLIVDLSNQDLLQDTPPGSPLVPQPVAGTSMLEELETTNPPFSFLNESVLPHRKPLQPEVLPQPSLSQDELAAVRTAWQGIDSLRMAMETQGAQLAAVTSRMHSAELEVRNLKRSATSHPEDPSPVVKKFCVEEAVRQMSSSRKRRDCLPRKQPHSRLSQARRERGEAWLQQLPPEVPCSMGSCISTGGARALTTDLLSTTSGW